MKPIDAAGFEAKFRLDVDPWDYASSPFEAVKREVLMHACGYSRRARVLELACANGETTKALSKKSLRLLAIDGSPTAIEEARRRTRGYDRITFGAVLLPEEMPRGPFDLIVVSELLYYLRPNELRRLLLLIAKATAPGGRVVLLHHLRSFSDVSLPPPLVHMQARYGFKSRFHPPRRQNRGTYELMTFDKRL